MFGKILLSSLLVHQSTSLYQILTHQGRKLLIIVGGNSHNYVKFPRLNRSLSKIFSKISQNNLLYKEFTLRKNADLQLQSDWLAQFIVPSR